MIKRETGSRTTHAIEPLTINRNARTGRGRRLGGSVPTGLHLHVHEHTCVYAYRYLLLPAGAKRDLLRSSVASLGFTYPPFHSPPGEPP